MKKIVTSLVFSLSLLFVVGCLDATGGANSSSIIGRWGMTESESGSTFEVTSNFKDGGALDLEVLITKIQLDDSTSLEGAALNLAIKDKSFTNPTVVAGTWSTSGDTLTTTLPHDFTGTMETEKSIYSITANKLTITGIGDTTVMILTKK